MERRLPLGNGGCWKLRSQAWTETTSGESPVVFPTSRSIPKIGLFSLTCRTGRTDTFEYRTNGAAVLGANCYGISPRRRGSEERR